jgi:hypothetical protein
MDVITLINWTLFSVGLLGFIGALRGWKVFVNEDRMPLLIEQFGRQNVRRFLATCYLILGILGLLRIIGD